MRVLDIDLDLFVNEPAYMPQEERLSSDFYQPWPESDVVSFLEDQCGLSTKNPVDGRVIDDHHEAFFFWKDMIESRRLSVPFEVVHADSHADLGLGDAGWVYLMGELLHLPKESRSYPKVGTKYMNLGNYLAFAIGCGWLSKLTYVHHPQGGGDLMVCHFKGFDTSSRSIELKCCHKSRLHQAHRNLTSESFGVISTEPEVPFEMESSTSFRTRDPFDYIVLSRSRRYTPKESDLLVPVFDRYIKAI